MEEELPEIQHFNKERKIIQSTNLYTKIFNYILGVIETEAFQAKVLSIRSEFGIPLNGFSCEDDGEEKDFGQPMFLATRKLTIELKLTLDWRETIENYILYNKIFIFDYADTFEVIDLQSLTGDENVYPEDFTKITQKDTDYDYLQMLSEDHPIAILIPPFASQRDIIDYIKKAYAHSILPLQKEYASQKAPIGKYKSRNDTTRARNQLIYENRGLSIKELRELLAKDKIYMDDGLIGKIRSLEQARRKEV